MSPPVENIAGYTVGTQSVSACIADLVLWIKQAPPGAPCRWLACLNPHSYAVALDDPPFAQALHAANWLIPDGAGIVLASKLLGGQIRERVTGKTIRISRSPAPTPRRSKPSFPPPTTRR